MPKFKNIKIKMKGGKSRIQRVMVLASGKFKFVKNKRNQAKTIGPKRGKSNKKSRKSQRITTTKKKSTSVGKKKKSVSRSRGIFDKITKNKFVKGAALGLGGGALAIQISNRFAPQFSGIAQPLGAFVFGGPIGLVASVLLQGGLGFLTGGSSNGDTTNARDTL